MGAELGVALREEFRMRALAVLEIQDRAPVSV